MYIQETQFENVVSKRLLFGFGHNMLNTKGASSIYKSCVSYSIYICIVVEITPGHQGTLICFDKATAVKNKPFLVVRISVRITNHMWCTHVSEG